MAKKILIIEAETRMSHLLKMYLQKLCYQIEVNVNGEAGLNQALNNHFDLIIIDVLLPEKDGLVVLEELRKIKLTPVVMISSLCGETFHKRSLALGANEYLLMPFSPRTIVAKITEMLDTSVSHNPVASYDRRVFEIHGLGTMNDSFESASHWTI